MLPIQHTNSTGFNFTVVVAAMRVKVHLTDTVNLSIREAKNEPFRSSMGNCTHILIKEPNGSERLDISW